MQILSYYSLALPLSLLASDDVTSGYMTGIFFPDIVHIISISCNNWFFIIEKAEQRCDAQLKEKLICYYFCAN
jgi:hypothetical protein